MVDHRRVDIGGADLHVEICGSGDALVLLHGFAASTFTWRELAPTLAVGHRVIAIDRLGFGASDRPRVADYSFSASIGHTATVLDSLGVDRATLIGHSAGAALGAEIALAQPSRVAGLVLIAPAIVASGPPPFVKAAFRVPGVRHVAAPLLRAGAPLFGRALRRTWAVGSRVTPEVVRGYLDPLRADGTAEALVQMSIAEPPRDDLVDRLPRLDLPALVITGAADRVVNVADARRVADALDCPLVVVDDAGHLPHEEQPAVTLAAIQAFLRTV